MKFPLVGSTNCSQFNGSCSHLCLPNPHGYRCLCPEGVQLKPGDAFTCEGGKVWCFKFQAMFDINRSYTSFYVLMKIIGQVCHSLNARVNALHILKFPIGYGIAFFHLFDIDKETIHQKS